MKTRVAIGSALVAIVAGLLWLDHHAATASAYWCPQGLPLAVVVAALGIVGVLELSRMTAQSAAPLLPITAMVGVLVVGSCPLWLTSEPDGTLLLLGVMVSAIFLEQMIRARTENAVRRVGATSLAMLYLGVGGALILSLRLRYGVPTLLLFLAGVKGTDIGAYFTGTLIGRRKLIPWLSPGKSWEGLIGGLLTGAGGALLVRWATGMEGMGLWQAGVFGACVGLAGQFGDLCESLLKRSAGVKDSGAVLPEFGGVLDIVDSPLLASPAGLLLMALLGR